MPFFDDQQLRKALTAEISDVGQALADREWKAATVLGGAVLEAVLFWALVGMKHECAGLKDKPTDALEKWELKKLIDVSRKLKLIEEPTRKLADLARDSRNLVHPGAVLQERRDCDKATSHTVVAAIEAVVKDLNAFCLKVGRKL